MGQHICFGSMCDIVANSQINVIKETFIKKNTDYMDMICHIEQAIPIYDILGIQKWFSHK